MANDKLNVRTLRDLYQQLDLPVDYLEEESGFTIHYLEETFKDLPFRSEPFRPNYFSFLFIKSAFGHYTIDDQRFEVTSDTVYFTNPGNYRIFEWEKLKHTCLITFGEGFLKEYVHDDVYRDFSFLLSEVIAPRVLTQEQFGQIEELYTLIHKEYKGHSLYKNKIIGALVIALLLKIKEYFFQDYDPIYEGNRSSQIVKTFKLNVEQHFRDLINGKTNVQLRVQDYADLQALHVNYLSSVISSKTGKTISSWIADKATTEAKVMLQDEKLTIKEIAARLGFLETPHFSNYFKKHTSISPAEYRKQYFGNRS
ncbi:AraC family transcriptional regulator [Chryseobacterium sp.]|jgi:AraC-like DNA-binding protein|uniref:helix-turn-helix domain-containing protein n=1 Tax=Chryseobacterium sp. TaxID=1871047 RepID=UPI00283EA0D4|nr:AraC family transcriptional regulator [Chryseobacterium sp.]MDR3023048.1 AraC family transcriptional regulator [Chryseobacterium sp.]